MNDNINTSLVTFNQAIDAMLTGLSGLQQFQENILNQYKEMKDELKLQSDRIETQQKQIDELRQYINESKEALKAQVIQEERYDGYINLTEFGERMMPSVSSHRVARLFKVVGLAKKRRAGRTEPYFQKIREGYAKRRVTIDGHVFYVWHHAMCTELIEQWLTDHDLYYDFKSHKSTEERERFIDKLYWDYVMGLGTAS